MMLSEDEMDLVVIEADEGVIALLPSGSVPEAAAASLPSGHAVTFLSADASRPDCDPDAASAPGMRG